MRKARIVQPKRYGRRSASDYQMNAGGLLWPTVRERAKALHVTREKEKLAFWVQLGLNLGLIRFGGRFGYAD